MSVEAPRQTEKPASETFRAVATPKATAEKRNATAPFSLRLSKEERKRLQSEAGSKPLGAYIRTRLLGEHAEKRRTIRQPGFDQKKLALILAELGRSRLASSMNEIAKAAKIGVLDASPDTIQNIEDACQHIRDMREMLIVALGVKPESGG